MAMIFISAVIAVLLVHVCCLPVPVTIHVKDGEELVSYLCHINATSTNLVLDHSVNYVISSSSPCVIKGDRSLTIKSDDQIKPAIVNCSGEMVDFGIAFVNVNVTIIDVSFIKCGSLLTNFTGLNITVLSFSPTHYALFVFVKGTIHFQNVTISNYNGFAVIAINTMDANFTEVLVTQNNGGEVSCETGKSIGSGVLVIYSSLTSVAWSYHLVFHNSTFSTNSDCNNNSSSKRCAPLIDDKSIYNAAGLTVLSYGMKEIVSVDILQTVFRHNYGTEGGALFIGLVNTKTTTVNVGDNSEFDSNWILFNCLGAAIAFYMTDAEYGLNDANNTTIIPLSVTDTIFKENRGFDGIDLNTDVFKAGNVYVRIKDPSVRTLVEFRNVEFVGNKAFKTASCLFFKVEGYLSSFVCVTLEQIFACGNNQSLGDYLLPDTGLFVFIDVDHVYFKGNNHFNANIGTVIKSYRSSLYLQGSNTFRSNHAQMGAAINIEDSHLYIDCTKPLVLVGNSVNDVGGAIYIYNTNTDTLPLCAVQFSLDSCKITSQNNIAVNGGNVMFAYPIYNCYEKDHSLNRLVKTSKNYTKLFNINEEEKSNDLLEISTKVSQLIICNDTDISTKMFNSTFFGENIPLRFLALDEAHNSVYSRVHVQLVKTNKEEGKFVVKKSKIVLQEQTNAIKETRQRDHCTVDLYFKVSYHDNINETGRFYLMATPLKSIETTQFMPIHLRHHCPLGFRLGDNGYCQCSPAVKKFYEMYNMNANCDIDNRTIKKPTNFINPWLGKYNGTSNFISFAIAYDCPIEFCNSNRKYSHYTPTDNEFRFTNSNNTHSESLCKKNRNGLMCSNCMKSVVFGSGDCIDCSIWSLWTILLFIVSGPLILCVLFGLRLTLTAGTINGIIFFAQTANVGILQMLEQYKTDHPVIGTFLFVFVSMLNLNLGFPLCFFAGMTELHKVSLSLIFPVYLLSIAMIVVIVCRRYSFRLSYRINKSSAQVLITILHLSISNLLITAIDVFTPVRLIVDNREDIHNPGDIHNPEDLYVWYRDGRIPFSFSQTKLICLMVATIIIVTAFLIPYIILLTAGKFMIKSSFGEKYFRSVYESIHCPYQETRKYWFAARFFLLVTMYLIFAFFRGYNISIITVIILPLLAAFLLLQVYLRPFKSKLITFLDTVVLLDLVLIYTIEWYLIFDLRPTNYDMCMTLVTVLVSIIFVLFVFVLVHHVLVATSFYQRVIIVWKYYKNKKVDSNQLLSSPSKESFFNSQDAGSNSQYKSCNNVRRPITEY